MAAVARNGREGSGGGARHRLKRKCDAEGVWSSLFRFVALAFGGISLASPCSSFLFLFGGGLGEL